MEIALVGQVEQHFPNKPINQCHKDAHRQHGSTNLEHKYEAAELPTTNLLGDLGYNPPTSFINIGIAREHANSSLFVTC